MVLASQRTLVAVSRTGIIDQAVALALPVRHVALQLTVFLGTQTPVTGFVYIRRVVVLADSELLIRPLDPLLNGAPAQTQHRYYE